MADVAVASPFKKDGKFVQLKLVDQGDGTFAIAVSGAGGASGGGDASAANQGTQIARLDTLIAQTDTVEAGVGAVADAAAAADGIGNYGLIAGIKRALLNWAALLARLPASLGAKSSAASLSVTQATLTRTDLLSGATTTGAGAAFADTGYVPSFSAQVAGTGTVSATVLIQARNVSNGQWLTLGTITLSGSAAAVDGFGSLVRYMEYRANVTAISGTGATVNVSMGA